MGRMCAGLAILMLTIIVLTGCAANSASVLMDSKMDIVKGQWQDLESMEKFFNDIKPYETKLSDFGFDLKKEPNVIEFGYSDVESFFLINPSIKKENLPGGVQDCLNSPDECRGLRVERRGERTKGRGNIGDFFLRWGKFKKVNQTIGWEGKFYLFFRGDLIVYKRWGGGTSNIDKENVEKRPLGPFQDIDPLRFLTIP